MTTLVVSDIHIASRVSQAKELTRFLKQNEKRYDRIIILGDLFETHQFRAITKDHIKLLGKLRKLSDRGVELIWLEGNHDDKVIDEFAPFIGAEVIPGKDEYTLQVGGKKYLFLHGHQFDTIIAHQPTLTKIATGIYSIIQSLDTRQYTVSRWIKRKSKTFLGVCKANSDRALKHARKRDCDVIVCGHVHLTAEVHDRDLTYLNSGSWVDVPCTYIEIHNDGHYELLEHWGKPAEPKIVKIEAAA